MNEGVLYALAEVAAALAGFSGLVVVFRLRGAQRWTSTELRFLWFLIVDSFLVLLLALLPIPLALAGWSEDLIWSLCCLLLGAWYLAANVLAIRGERGDRAAGRSVNVPFITPILYAATAVGFVIGAALWLSAFDVIVPRGQALFVLGLIGLVGFAAIEFLFFIGLMSPQSEVRSARE